MDSNEIIYCIGDSHASFFSGYDEIQPVYPSKSKDKYVFFKSYRLGAVLAYNLNKFNTKERGKEKLLDCIGRLESGSTLLLCFGEIDCRCHLLKQATIQDVCLEVIIKNCINNYFEMVHELIKMNFKILIWGVIPSAESDNKEYPTYGSMEDRNRCTSLFNYYLNQECLKMDLKFISIFDYLIDKKYKTKIRYYFDSIHLGQLAMPLALKKFKTAGIEAISIKYKMFYIDCLIYISNLGSHFYSLFSKFFRH